MNKTIKKLRFELETPMVKEKDVDAYDIPSMHQGETLPNNLIENRIIADMVRFMAHNNDCFMIDDHKADILFDYFVGAEKPFNIAQKRDITLKQVNQIVLRTKKKAIKLLKNQIKKTDIERLKEKVTKEQ